MRRLVRRFMDWLIGRSEPDPRRLEAQERRIKRLSEELAVMRRGERRHVPRH